MGTIRNVLGFVGVLLVGGAVYGLWKPQMLPSVPVTLTGSIIIVVLIVIMAGIGILAFRMAAVDTQTLLTYRNRPEQSHEAVGPTTKTLAHRSTIHRERLQTAVKHILEEKGHSAPEQAIEDGSWTDDRVAAAFVSETCSYPILDRLRSWLEQDGTAPRRLKRTVKAMNTTYTEGE